MLLAAELTGLRIDGALRALEQNVHAAVGEVDGARHELRAVHREPVGRRNDASSGSRCRMQLQRQALDAAEPPARAAEELAEVVAGDVLHDLATRARASAVGKPHG